MPDDSRPPRKTALDFFNEREAGTPTLRVIAAIQRQTWEAVRRLSIADLAALQQAVDKQFKEANVAAENLRGLEPLPGLESNVRFGQFLPVFYAAQAVTIGGAVKHRIDRMEYEAGVAYEDLPEEVRTANAQEAQRLVTVWIPGENGFSDKGWKYFKSAYNLIESEPKIPGKRGEEAETAIFQRIASKHRTTIDNVRKSAHSHGWKDALSTRSLRDQIIERAKGIPRGALVE